MIAAIDSLPKVQGTIEVPPDVESPPVAMPQAVQPPKPPSGNFRKWADGKLRVFVRDDFRCQYCGRDLLADFASMYAATVDHLVPRAHGGVGAMSNLVTCCLPCNQLKATAVPSGLAAWSRRLFERLATFIPASARAEGGGAA